MKRHAPATLRNRVAIADVLAKELPESGTVLEIASGSGEHAAYFAEKFPALIWQPSDMEPEALASIAAYLNEYSGNNCLPPFAIDASSGDWGTDGVSAILCINMVHISPWEATVGLFAGAARLLPSGAPLILYGPFFEDDVASAPSNLAFDASLRARNPDWAIRNTNSLNELAQRNCFERTARHEMPANNLTLVFRAVASAELAA